MPERITWQQSAFFLCVSALLLHGLFWIYPVIPDIYGVKGKDIPLLVMAFLGAVPLLWVVGKSLWQRDLGADVLAGIYVIVALIQGEYLAALLVNIMLFGGQSLENYAQRKASSVLLLLSKRMPSIAHKKCGESIQEVELSSIEPGDIAVIYPHETCPADGVVIEGFGAMDEAYLTGEPYLVSKAPGSSVLSGAINGDALLVMQVTAHPRDSRYAKIMAVMEEAEQKRPQLRRIADQLGALFAPFVLIVAGITWFITGDAGRFLSIIMVATPCPLLIAVPVAIVSAISLAAKRSIIIKDPTILERLPTCRTAMFDKTGTLTYGRPSLTRMVVLGTYSETQLLTWVASLERYSKHPLASAFLEAAKSGNIEFKQVEAVSEKPGEGLKGRVDRQYITITHRRLLEHTHPDLVRKLPPREAGLECVILVNEELAAVCHFHDAIRTEGKAFIRHLAPSHAFSTIMILSGDREEEVTYLARQLGVTDMYANQTPEQKLAIVRKEVAKAPTLFMGDGINDAPALAAATVGLAFGHHNAVTSEAAGAVILDSNLKRVDELMHLSISLRRIVLQSAVGGVVLSIIGMGGAAFGYISPVEGAVIQEVIDIAAILNALRLTWNRKVEADM